jgi:hypothetical protein
MALILETPLIRLTHHPEHRLFETTILGTTSGEEFRAGCLSMLAIAEKLSPRLWLTDNRLMQQPESNDLIWLAEHFIPRFAELPVARAAIVYSHEMLSRLALDGVLEQATPYISWQERSFESYHEAWWWLMKGADKDWDTWTLSDE